MLWGRFIGPWQRRYRIQRAHRILARFPDIQGAHIIDVGGSAGFWKIVQPILKPAHVRMYNIGSGGSYKNCENLGDGLEFILYDGKEIPELDKSADFVICNSVIEHVADEERPGLAREIVRVGKKYVVQTPAKIFPIEPHFGMPFVHWLPRPIGRVVVKLSPFRFLSNVSATAYFDNTKLLPRRELAELFPGATVEIEYEWGLPKSLLAFGEA